MDARSVRNISDARHIVEQRGLDHVKVGLFDIDGVMRGKYMSRDKFFSALDKGFGFCDVVLGWDSNDQLYENPGVEITGWHTGYPDAEVRIIPESCREVAGEEGMLLFLAEFDGEASTVCPRGMLRRVLDKAASMGFDCKAALEYEFFLFNETPDSVREKHYQNLQPATPGFFGYSMLRNSVHSDWYQELLSTCQTMDFPLEGLHTETGPGVLEAAIAVDDALAAADKAALFKTYTKVWAQRRGMMATFMAKWSNDWPGQSGHLHLSLQDREQGASAFYRDGGEHSMSEQQRQFVAGQLALMPEFTAMLAPTVNAYSRMIPGFWAPTAAAWGTENRTTALRVISGSAASQRVEHRLCAADGNPYLVMAAGLASGLYGIEQKLELGAACVGNAYEQEHAPENQLPETLSEAARMMSRSQAARSWFSDVFVDHYVQTRLWEEREARKHISDWELARYFEII